jgi:phenylalanyl-tRNA synthetase beta chain
VTLDGKVRSFERAELLITDPSGPIAVAGVMGGLATEVTARPETSFSKSRTSTR